MKKIVLKLWEKEIPLSGKRYIPDQDYKEESRDRGKHLYKVTEPTLTVFLPEKKNRTKTGIVICPGGGYTVLVIDREGYSIAKRLVKWGITAAVLKYRMYSREAAHLDAQRALRLMKSNASKWGLDKKKVGIGGFSAGGHLSTNVILNQKSKGLRRKDRIDSISPVPPFGMLIYPGLKSFTKTPIPKNTPPCFQAVAQDDNLTPAVECIAFHQKLCKKGIPSELHVFQDGKHGFDIGRKGMPTHHWPAMFRDWLSVNRLL